MNPDLPRLPIYRWNDGVSAELVLDPKGLAIEFTDQGRGSEHRLLIRRADDRANFYMAQFVPPERMIAVWAPSGNWAAWRDLPWVYARSLVSDLGGRLGDEGTVGPIFVRRGIVLVDDDRGARSMSIPLFVEDEIFRRQIKAIRSSRRRERLRIGDVSVSKEKRENDDYLIQIYPGKWVDPIPCKIYSLDAVEPTIRRHALVMPASERQEWTRKSFQMGELLTLSRDEVDLFEMMGERCPVWWPTDRAIEFFRERIAMPDAGRTASHER